MKKSILMVCLGNICRSPLAEGILEEKLPQDRFRLDSSVTAGYQIVNSPDHRGIEVAENNDIDISHQKARKFCPDDFGLSDKIFVMDRSYITKIRKMALTSDHTKKVALLLGNDAVPVPYYGNKDGFKKVFELIDKASDQLSDELQKSQS